MYCSYLSADHIRVIINPSYSGVVCRIPLNSRCEMQLIEPAHISRVYYCAALCVHHQWLFSRTVNHCQMAWPWWWEASILCGIHPWWWALQQHLTVSPCVAGLFIQLHRRLSLRGKGCGAVDQIYICTRHGQPLDESCGVCRSRVSQQWWWAAIWRCSVLGWDVTIYPGAAITRWDRMCFVVYIYEPIT